VNVADLMAKLEELVARIEKLEQERDEYRRLYLDALEKNRKLELGLLGQKAERVPANDNQLTLQLLSTLLGEDEAKPKPDADPGPGPRSNPPREHKPTGRKPLPENLPRIEIELIPDEVQRKGRDAFDVIGQEVRETVERRPSSLVVVRTIRPKFVPKERHEQGETTVHIAAPLELPIERGLAGPGLMAYTIVARWQDHIPLHRLAKVFGREGLELARSTICEWHSRLSELIEPLVEAMWSDALYSPYLCVDATGVLVQAKERCRRGHFWVAVAPGRHVLYAYSPRHDSEAVDQFLGKYEGYLVADAHAVYDHLYADGTCIEVGCWAHARRYYFKALESDPERAREALALIRALFQLEREFATLSPRQRKRARQLQSRPLVERFFEWCDAQAQVVLDDTPIEKAIQYARNQREALKRFLDDGRLPLHNNISELHLRRQAVGRKNWLFIGNDDAGEVNTNFVSLLASCEMHGVEPFAYIRDLLILLPSWPRSRVLELAPVNWASTIAREDVVAELEGNVFRQIGTRAA
jgi:transposase